MASGTFSAVGAGTTLRLLPNETLTAVLSVAPAAEFIGTIALEVSRDGGSTWQIARCTPGSATNPGGLLKYVLAAGSPDLAVTDTVKNETSAPEYYRWFCPVFTAPSADLAWSLTTVAQDVVEVVLRDSRGRVMLEALDSGGVRVPGELITVGAQTVSGGLTGAVAPTSIALATGVTEYVTTGTIAAADITGTSAGQFGHAAGVPLVTVASGYCLEFVSLVACFDRITAAYGNGGNITVNATGGLAITGLVSAANSLGAAADAQYVFYPLTTAAVAAVAATGVSLVSSAAFTVASSSAGVIRWKLRYRLVLIA